MRYINTDLDLESHDDLSAIAAYFEEGAEVLHADRLTAETFHVGVEAMGSGLVGDPESCPERDIASMLTLLEQMPAELKVMVSGCTKFEFNIGWHSSEHRPVGEFALSPGLLARIASIGARLGVTVYPSSENEW